MQTIVTAAFVRSPQNFKCPVLGNCLVNSDSVHGDHGLLGDCDKLVSTIFLSSQQFN